MKTHLGADSVSVGKSHSPVPSSGKGDTFRWEIFALVLGGYRESREFFLHLLILNCLQLKINHVPE